MYRVLVVVLGTGCLLTAAAFQIPAGPSSRIIDVATRRQFTVALAPLAAAQKKKKAAAGGGGFGASTNKARLSSETRPKVVTTIRADKTSLEKQWDYFVAITDLEITPKEDEDFQVVDIFVRSAGTGEKEGTKWFRVGKACAEGADSNSTTTNIIDAALTLQKGLIFWTAVHMRRELVAAGGKSGAASLEVGYTASSMMVGSEADGPIDDEKEDEDGGLQIIMAERVSVQDVTPKSVGFRPDWNPPGFTYKRRENAARKKTKVSISDEIASIE
jgi:hypothetical protein